VKEVELKITAVLPVRDRHRRCALSALALDHVRRPL
jgi:hypothetical protein